MKPWQEVALNILMWGTVFPAMLFGALALTGMMMDGIADQKEQHDRCLKRATNGYEIRRCG